MAKRGKRSKEETEDRRRQVWEMLVRGTPQTVIAKTLGVHRNTVNSDVRELRKRHRSKVKDSDVHEELGDAIAKYDELFKLAMEELSVAEKETHRTQFMEKAIQALNAKTRLLVDTGILPKAAHEVTDKLVIEGVDVNAASLSELKALRTRMLSRVEQMSQSADN